MVLDPIAAAHNVELADRAVRLCREEYAAALFTSILVLRDAVVGDDGSAIDDCAAELVAARDRVRLGEALEAEAAEAMRTHASACPETT